MGEYEVLGSPDVLSVPPAHLGSGAESYLSSFRSPSPDASNNARQPSGRSALRVRISCLQARALLRTARASPMCGDTSRFTGVAFVPLQVYNWGLERLCSVRGYIAAEAFWGTGGSATCNHGRNHKKKKAGAEAILALSHCFQPFFRVTIRG